MTTLKTLRAAREKIANRKNWTQKVFARNKRSVPVPTFDQQACRWCAIGAIRYIDQYSNAWAYLERFTPERDVAEFNDSHTHAEVLALFDKAIASL